MGLRKENGRLKRLRKALSSLIKIGFLLSSLILVLLAPPFMTFAHVGSPLSAWAWVPPTINGVINAAEWAPAAKVAYTTTGGISGVFYVMNDAVNLYIAVTTTDPTLSMDTTINDKVMLYFDNNHNGVGPESGDDIIGWDGYLSEGFKDGFSVLGAFAWYRDTDYGGTRDGAAAATNNGTHNHFEIMHPLNTADNAHDFSLSMGNTVGFAIRLGVDGYDRGWWPTSGPSGWRDIVISDGTIYIRANGEIDPPSAPITRNRDLYTLTNNIYTIAQSGIVIERNNMTLDGAGYRLQGNGSIYGIVVRGRNNVTITNVEVKAFSYGVYLASSVNNNIRVNNIVNSAIGVWLGVSSYNTVTRNVMAGNFNFSIMLYGGSLGNVIRANGIESNTGYGIGLFISSNDNSISGNRIVGNGYDGIYIYSSSNNKVFGNDIAANTMKGISLYNSTGNVIYHNNFISNGPPQASTFYSLGNVWDDGYPSGGNYWSDYTGVDLYSGPNQDQPGSDGIGDTRYLIDSDNQDRYPLMQSWTAQTTQYPWPMFHHNPRHTGYTESPAPRTNQIRWTYPTSYYVRSSPAVAEGKVYVASDNGWVYSLDASTGAFVWSYLTGGYVYSSPAVADGKVYVGSASGYVYALDASTGAYVWSNPTGSPVYSSPAVADGKVYVASYSGAVYSLDASTGAYVWSYPIPGGYSSPAVADGKVFVGSLGGLVYALDASTGAYLWSYPTGNAVYSSPAVADGKVYVGSTSGYVYALDASTGAYLWSYPTGVIMDSSPAVAYGKVYVGSYYGGVYSLDASTGAYVWSYPTGITYSSPAVADGKVYVGSTNRYVYSLDASTGAFIWSYPTGGPVYSSPAVADGTVFIGSDDNLVYAFGNIVRVPQDYPTVQQAIDAATPGATILIEPGTYRESIVITKTLTIMGKKGSGTEFAGGGSGIAITISGTAASGTIVTNVMINYYAQGILVDNSAQVKIYNNIMYAMVDTGIALKGSYAANNLIYSNTFQNNKFGINVTDYSTSNTIYGNTISSNYVGINLKTGGNTIYANTISGNLAAGIKMTDSNGNTIYSNNFINTVQIDLSSSSSNAWDNGYPNGGNYWSNYAGVDVKSGPNQDHLADPDGIGDTPYIIDSNNRDRYPLMKPYGGDHDIGIRVVTALKTVVGQGYNLNIEVTILSYGIYTETRNIKIYANTIVVASQDVMLTNRHTVTLTFTWYTAGYDKGVYNLRAYATPITGDDDTGDNNREGGTVKVTIAGDINGDGIVDALDLFALSKSYGTTPSIPNWNPNANINNDLTVNNRDLSILSQNYGKS